MHYFGAGSHRQDAQKKTSVPGGTLEIRVKGESLTSSYRRE
jgi:hypothetical protein